MKWTVAFDSGCDLRSLPNTSDIDIEIAPLKIVIGERSVEDNGEVSLEILQRLLDEEKGKTGTACPGVEDWRKCMEKGDNVICITISGQVSGSYQSALIAKEMILEENPDKNIFVLNTLAGSGSQTFLARRAVRLIEEGKDFDSICEEITEYAKRTKPFFIIQNVDNLISNGRLNPIIGKAIKTLRLCLIATVSEIGDLEVIGKTRDFQKAMDKCLEECKRRGYKGENIIISHCMNEKGAEILEGKLNEVFDNPCVESMRTSLLCGYYVEKGGLICTMEE